MCSLDFKRQKKPYLLYKKGDNDCEVVWNPPSVPSQYLRSVLADHINVPQLADWRDVNRAFDESLCKETVQCLKPYFNYY